MLALAFRGFCKNRGTNKEFRLKKGALRPALTPLRFFGIFLIAICLATPSLIFSKAEADPASCAAGVVTNLFDSSNIKAFPIDLGSGIASGYVGYRIHGVADPWIQVSTSSSKLTLASNQSANIKAVGSSIDVPGDKLAYVYLTASALTTDSQTVTIDVTGFVGSIVIEATLDSVAETATWFTTETYSSVTPLTDRHPFTVTGNFTWVRLHVTNFDTGTINFITIGY